MTGLLARLSCPRLLRFAITGGSAGLIQLGLLHRLEAVGVTPTVANALGFLMSAQVNFLLSQLFTWADRPLDATVGESIGWRWARFHLAISGTAALNMLVFAVAGLALPDLVASAAGIGAAAVANYLLADRVVFRRAGRVAVPSAETRHTRLTVYHGARSVAGAPALAREGNPGRDG